jgi:hypothetical protein
LKEPGIDLQLINVPGGAIIAVAFVSTNGASFDQVREVPPSDNVRDSDSGGVGVANNGGLVVALQVPPSDNMREADMGEDVVTLVGAFNKHGVPDGARSGPLPALPTSASVVRIKSLDRDGTTDVSKEGQNGIRLIAPKLGLTGDAMDVTTSDP